MAENVAGVYLMPVLSKPMGVLAPSVRVLAGFLALGAPCAAQWAGDAGDAGFDAIAVVSAARPAGLAGAGAASGTGASAIGINPAGLAREPGTSYSGSVQTGLTRVGAIAYARPLAGGAFAFGAAYLDHGEIAMTDEDNVAGGTLRPFNLYPSATYARALGTEWFWGATVKAGRETLGDFEGSRAAYGAGFDAGVQYQPEGRRDIGFGASLTNVGRQFTGYFDGDGRRRPLPGAVRAGAFYQPRTRRQLTVSADVEAPFHAPLVLAVGGEYRVMPEWILRAGTRWSSEDLRNLRGWIDPNAGIEERGGDATKLAAGTTVRIGPVAVDYAAQWRRELGIVHFVTLAWSAN